MRKAAVSLVATLVLVSVPAHGRGENAHKWESYIQLRYTDSQDRRERLSIRRLKLYGSGPIAGDWTYFAQLLYKTGNLSPTDNRIYLQEANLLHRRRNGTLTIGQFKPPFGMERFTSDATLALIDRSQPTDRLIPNGNLGESFARDLGIQWEGSLGKEVVLAAGVFGGNGANRPFHGNGPLLVAKLAGSTGQGSNPRIRAEVAASWRRDENIDFSQQVGGSLIGYGNFSGADMRWNAGIGLDGRDDAFRSEYFLVRYDSDREVIPDATATGFYIQWAHSFSRRWAAAIRYEDVDPNNAVRDAKDITWITLGVTRFIDSHREKIQANYVWKSEEAGDLDNDAFLVQYQRFF